MWTSRYQLKGKLTGHGDWVNKLLIYNEKYLISCSDDKTIRVKMGVISLYLQIWDLSTEKCISTLNKHQKGVCSLCIMGSTLISGGTDFSIIVLLDFLFSLKAMEFTNRRADHFIERTLRRSEQFMRLSKPLFDKH